MRARNRWLGGVLAAALLLGAGCFVAFAQRGGGDERPLWIAVRPTAFERPPNVRVGDELRYEPNLTVALNALERLGYEPKHFGADDKGPLILARRR